MGRQTRKSAGGTDPAPAASKKARTAAAAAPAATAPRAQPRQRGIAEALAAQSTRAATDLVLEVEQPRAQLERRLAEELSGHAEAYLQMWADKCYGARGEAAGAAGSKGGATKRARRLSSAAASLAGEETQLDEVALRFMEVFRHLQQQAFKHEACLDPRHLEILVTILRSDVLHAFGDVSHQAYCLLRGYLQRFPYARLERHEGGSYAGRPFVVFDTSAAWQPLAALSNRQGLTKRYLFEEAIKDAGHNYRLDHSGGSAASAMLAASSRKKGGLLGTTLSLLKLCFDRAVDSVDEDHNGDVLLLRYLLALLHQDLAARIAVFAAYGVAEEEAVQRRRGAVLQNSLLWRIWTDDTEDDNCRRELMGLLMKLIVGVASEADLQEVDEEHHELDKEAEAAAPCICTPRELASLASLFLSMLLDLFGTAEAAGGFHSAAANRLHRHNQRLKLDQLMKELFWKWPGPVCGSEAAARTFLAALAPAHRMRLLSLVAMEQVEKAYFVEEAAKRPAVSRGKALLALLKSADSGDHLGAFPADPVVALQCLNQDRSKAVQVFTHVGGGSAMNNLAVLSSGIALAAHSVLAAGGQLPCCDAGSGAAPAARQQLKEELSGFLGFLAEKHRELAAAGKPLELSRASLCDLLNAQAAVALI
ncbi:hypothetical protein ABPG75_013315 [Micractinium tetrahymenae]